MRDLTYNFKQLAQRNRDGSFATQANRMRMLSLFADQLQEAGFYALKTADQLKGRHVEALVRRWQKEQISAGTMKNRMSVIRWWAEKVNKASVVYRDNKAYGINNRQYVTNEQKAQVLDQEKWALVADERVKMSLALQKAFGLRKEEAIKFQPAYADQGGFIRLKSSWTKGGKERVIPVRNEAQRLLLDSLYKAVGKASLIPPTRSYIQQVKIYERHTQKVGLSKLHGLRHQYAQDRYTELTGLIPPAAGGKSSKALSVAEKQQDLEARLLISREMGHEREQITAVYLGR
jgi:integrase